MHDGFDALVQAHARAAALVGVAARGGARPERVEAQVAAVQDGPPLAPREDPRAGHGGGDFFTSYHFAEAIRSGEPPYLDVYRGIDMSIAGIQAWRSALNDSAPVAVPDFRDEAVRRQYENDDWSPDPERAKEGQPPSSILGTIEPSDDAKKLAKKIWSEQGYDGD